ncbi:GIY-YIG nuclease family protein [Francisella tularensis]|uniref:Endonuclease n=3 Tax=Francisella TaxID=262 RepID=A0ABF7PRH6_FRATH|nr:MULTISPECIES: GIY-YIG nuclease family protein [Francisella]AFX70237.1 endonuclease [Francisella tularensis subsp. holarctica F92]EBA52202.1 endonuclease [Francisella tularensis subsp. holarctica 257]AAP83342.1 unknown [Francisella tularensis subsp. holarctica]ABI82504.1 possible exci/endonuclease [Francisella tularensis subsp. holarctica OSU18]ABU61035.1 putative endonuclease with GIY-YIG domain [Francisella tularensis subsp. holarctica FTNF002-00]
MAFVYILASKKNGTLYIGVTANLIKRVYEHRQGFADGFTKKYDIKILVYYEQFKNIQDAIYREKRLKTWQRQWKIDLINEFNPDWLDLYESILD